MRRLTPIAVLAVVAASVLVLAAAGPAPAARSCGTVRERTGNLTSRYTIKVAKGSVSCASARRVLVHFIRTNRRSSGWDCRNGARGTSWSEACGSPYHSLFDTFRDSSFTRVIKAYYQGRSGDKSP
ncbi:MAG: hypothetical protein JWN32_3164 [Solirubrobacterales bacterium]|nr:hypothetical protein [Solirubrobacterales bacterium]